MTDLVCCIIGVPNFWESLLSVLLTYLSVLVICYWATIFPLSVYQVEVSLFESWLCVPRLVYSLSLGDYRIWWQLSCLCNWQSLFGECLHIFPHVPINLDGTLIDFSVWKALFLCFLHYFAIPLHSFLFFWFLRTFLLRRILLTYQWLHILDFFSSVPISS